MISSITWQKPQQARLLNGYKMYSSPLPGSGALLESIVKIFEQLDENKKSGDNLPLGLIESFKFAYAQRTKLGDTFKSPYKSQMEKVGCVFKRYMLFIRFISCIIQWYLILISPIYLRYIINTYNSALWRNTIRWMVSNNWPKNKFYE